MIEIKFEKIKLIKKLIPSYFLKIKIYSQTIGLNFFFQKGSMDSAT